jgi:hypothetical protein
MLNYTPRQGSRTQKLNQEKTLGNQIHQLAYQKYRGTSPSGAMARRRDGNHTPQKNNSIQDSVLNEENDTQFLTSMKQK